MNWSLFKSWYAALAVLAVGGTLVLALSGRAPGGVVDAGERALKLISGAVGLACVALALGYALRKYMHEYGYSPEFRFKVPIARLECAESRLNEIRAQILARRHASRRAVRQAVARALREERVQRILKVDVVPGVGGGPDWLLVVDKAFTFGRAAKWLHLHVYVSVAFAAAVWAHAGTSWGLDLGGALLALAALVLVTGVVGIALWAVGPRWLTRRERDLSIEEAYVLHRGFKSKLAELRERLGSDVNLRELLDDVVRSRADASTRAALRATSGHAPEQRALFEDACVLCGQMRRVELEFRALWRIRLAFMAWRAVHIPAAILLTVAVTVHVISIVRY